MMNWLLIAIIAYFIFAVVYVIDKFLISEISLKPVVYAFYVGILSLFVLLLVPWGFQILPFWQIIISFLSGILLIYGLIFFYRAFQIHEVSKITPIFGTAVPLFTLVLAFLILGERLNFEELIAFALLVVGGVIMMWPTHRFAIKGSKLIKGIKNALIGALLTAGSYVLSKYIFQRQPFINAFIWLRLGSFLGAFLLLISADARKAIFKRTKRIKIKTSGLIVFNKLLSALAFIMLNYAIFLGSVSLVNAFQGIQYFFLLIIAIILSKKFPDILEERLNSKIIIQKIIAIIFICFSLIILAF